MRQYITLDEFLAAARESMAKLAVYYNPDATSRVGSIRVASQGSTGSIAFKWRTEIPAGESQPVRILDALVNFPSLPVGARLTRREAELWLGYAVHEVAGHAFHTDTTAWDAAVVEGRSFARLVNGLEDPRIEAEACRKVPGARARLEALLEHILDRSLAGGYSPMDPENLPFTFALLGRVRLMGLLAERIKRDVVSKMTPASRAWFRKHLDTLAQCRSTADVVALARVIKSEVTLPPNTQGEDRPDLPGQGQDDEQGEQGEQKPGEQPGEAGDEGEQIPGADDDDEGPGQGGDAPAGDDGDEGKGGGQGDSQKPGQEPVEGGQGSGGHQDAPDAPDAPQGAPDGQGDGPSTGGAADAPPPPWSLPEDMGDLKDPEPDIGDTVQKIQDRADKSGDAGHAFGGCEVLRKVPFGGDTKTRVHATVADELKAAARLGSAKNRGLLRQILVANERTGWSTYERAGTLNPGDIARSQTGAGDVFRKRWVEEGISTSVSILVDGSSSMAGESMCYATAMAYVLSDVVEKCGLDTEVAVFRDGSVSARSLPVFDNGWRPVEDASQRYNPNAKRVTRADMGKTSGYKTGLYPLSENGSSQGDSCQLLLVQERGERLSNPEVQDRFIRMFTCAYSGTPDFAGTMGMVQRLIHTQGDRKILFVITDGAGNQSAMEWVVKWAKDKHDIDVIGVGIDDHTAGYLKRQYRLWTVAKLGRRCGAGGTGAGAAWSKFASEALTLLVKQARMNFKLRRSA